MHALALSLTLCAAGLAVAGSEATLDHVNTSIEAAWAQLRASGDFKQAEAAMLEQLDLLLANASTDDRELFRRATLAVRQVRHLSALDAEVAMPLLDYLQQHGEMAATLAFLVHRREKPEQVYALLDRLRQERGDQPGAWPSLTSAVCVVHDRSLVRRVNENEARSPDALDVFDFYVANEPYMLFGIQRVPAELLVYVVDTTASLEEMAWALKRHRGDASVGARFFDIEYDFDHFLRGAPKKVSEAGWNLPNIQRYGGVCVDQAYYAVSVGKAIGVPTAMASGKSAEVGHAWVGFLQARSGRAWWNFDIGRYEAYQGVRGSVYDPQFRRRIPDSYVSLRAELIGTTAVQRQISVALTDAAKRLLALRDDGLPPPADPAVEPPRRADVASTLELLEAALRTNAANTEAWLVMAGLADDGELTLEQKKRWAGVLHKLCGKRYPDFYLSIVHPMIESIDDVQEQNRLWNQAFKQFARRADLAAAVRMSQAHMWEQAGEPAKAGKCYEDVIGRFANAGPFVLSALTGAEKLLVDAAEGRRVLLLYERAWSSIKRPQDMAGPFYRQSNYYRVGERYAKWLERAGQTAQANAVRAQISR